MAAGRILLGLPFYGMTWPTVATRFDPQASAGRRWARRRQLVLPLRLAGDGLPAGAVVDHDPVEKSARITWYDDAKASWYQTYYDDPANMAPKARLAVIRGLAGMGIWALGYERGVPGYWQTISATFAPPTSSASRSARTRPIHGL